MKIERNLDFRRLHARSPQEWGYTAATDFWLVAGVNGILTAGNAHELIDYGWTATALSLATPSAADFLSSADQGVSNAIQLTAAGDLLSSPVIFGDYQHGQLAAQILGYTPTALVAEVFGSFSVASNNETATGFGFFEDGGAPNVANDHFAMITSNGTNFVLRSGAASDAGAAVDTANHLWKIVVTSASVEWFIDGTSQGTIALEADELPVGFGAGVLAATGANFMLLGWAHVYYV